MASPKDKIAFTINPFSGSLDAVAKFNPDRIVTHQANSAGNKLQILDPGSNQYIDLGDLVVTDGEGNVVTT